MSQEWPFRSRLRNGRRNSVGSGTLAHPPARRSHPTMENSVARRMREGASRLCGARRHENGAVNDIKQLPTQLSESSGMRRIRYAPR